MSRRLCHPGPLTSRSVPRMSSRVRIIITAFPYADPLDRTRRPFMPNEVDAPGRRTTKAEANKHPPAQLRPTVVAYCQAAFLRSQTSDCATGPKRVIDIADRSIDGSLRWSTQRPHRPVRARWTGPRHWNRRSQRPFQTLRMGRRTQIIDAVKRGQVLEFDPLSYSPFQVAGTRILCSRASGSEWPRLSRAGGTIIKTTVDHALMRGLDTAGPVMRRGASSV